MKTKILFLNFLLSVAFCFGQKNGEGKTNWSNWSPAPCFPNLQFSMKSNGWVSSVKKYEYLFKIRNTGSQNIHFSVTGQLSNGERFFSGRHDLKANGGEYNNGMDGTFSDFSPRDITGFTFTVTRYIENPKDDWGIPSYACSGGQRVCDRNCNSKNGNQNGNNQNNTSSPSSPNGNNLNNATNGGLGSGLTPIQEYDEYWKKREEICQKIPDLDKKAKYVFRSDFPCNTRETVADHQKQSELNNLKRNYQKLETILDELQNSFNKENDEKERLAKEKQEKYSSYIEKGDAAMQGEDYAGAMSNYQNAKNYATTDAERSAAEQKYNQAFEAKKAAERKVRIEQQQKRDQQENIAYTSAATATGAAMALMKDAPSPGFTSGKIYLGLNLEQIPMISNNTNSYHTNKSYIEAPLRPGVDFGIIFGIANNKKVAFYLNPKISYNINAFARGASGGNVEYGATGMVRGNWNRDFPLKFYVEGGYFKRVGDYHYDADAAAQDSGVSTSTDDVRDGEYNYSVLRYGGGVMFHKIDDDDEFMVKGGVFFDKPSFFPKDINPIIGFSFQAMYNAIGTLEFYYSPNYFIGGTVLYPSTLERENKSYFGIKFSRTGRLW